MVGFFTTNGVQTSSSTVIGSSLTIRICCADLSILDCIPSRIHWEVYTSAFATAIFRLQTIEMGGTALTGTGTDSFPGILALCPGTTLPTACGVGGSGALGAGANYPFAKLLLTAGFVVSDV